MRAPFQVLVIPFRLGNANAEFAILRRSNGQYWQFVAGGGEDDESPPDAAQRETAKEIGIVDAIGIVALDSMATVPKYHFIGSDAWGDKVFVVPEYCFAIDVGLRDLVLSEEHTEARWVSYREANDLLKWESNRCALWELNQRIKAGRLESGLR